MSKIVHAAASSVPGVLTVTTSWTQVASRNFPRSDVRVDYLAGRVDVDLHLAVTWPSPVTDIATQVQDTVSTWMAAMTGMKCTQVNVSIEHFVAEGNRVTADELARASREPRLSTIQAPPQTVVHSPEVAPPHPVFTPVTPPEPVVASSTPSPLPTPRSVGTPPEPFVTSVSVPPAPIVHTPRTPRQPLRRPVTVPAPTMLSPIYVAGVYYSPERQGRRVR